MPTLDELNVMASMVHESTTGPSRGPYFDLSIVARAEVMKLTIAAKQADNLKLLANSI